jgi:hypothetical protein
MSNIFAALYGLCSKSGVSDLKLEDKAITENGLYGPSEGFDAIRYVKVDVETPELNLEAKVITANGVYGPSAGYDAIKTVSVAVPETSVPGEAVIKRIDITANGTYSSTYNTDVEVIDMTYDPERPETKEVMLGQFDIPSGTFRDLVPINFKKLDKFAAITDINLLYRGIHQILLLENDEVSARQDLRDGAWFPLFIDENTNSPAMFGYQADPGMDTTGFSEEEKAMASVLLYTISSEGLAGTIFEGKLESGCVYMSSFIAEVYAEEGRSTIQLHIAAPSKERINGHLPITVRIPTSMYLYEGYKYEYNVGESLNQSMDFIVEYDGTGSSTVVKLSDMDQIVGGPSEVSSDLDTIMSTPGQHLLIAHKNIDGTTLGTSFQILVKEA